MKKHSLKLNELVHSELKWTEQSMIRGGDAVPSDTCHCVIVTEGKHRGSTTQEAINKPK